LDQEVYCSCNNSGSHHCWTIIVGLTIYLIPGQISLIKPEVSRVIAAGNAGTWFTFGYILYIVVGVIGVAVSALFYLYLERVLGKQYKKIVLLPELQHGFTPYL
jgi:hypothetical protein